MKTKTMTLWSAFAAAALPTISLAQDKTAVEANLGLSVRQEIEHATARANDALAKLQDPSGMWGQADFPALSALPVLAYFMDPGRDPEKDAVAPHIQKALDFIAGKAQSDGGIYGKGMGVYNTALSMLALHASRNPEYQPIILKARRFLINQQSDFDKQGEADNAFDGGIGYGGTYSHSDLSNTHLALEALYYTKDLLSDAPKTAESEVELDWEAAISFVERCQNRPESNKEAWASGDDKNKGGFIYFPGKSMAGEDQLAGGKVALRSYGSMSYAGLLSFIYAEMDKEDPRVQSVMEWLKANYSIDENPGMGQEGLFYYLHTMSKALAITGMTKLETADGKTVDWRQDLARKLLGSQKPDGTWLNDNGRWWENDPVLVTSFAVLALARAHESL